ncbi:MAG: sensor histidine kinase [Chloroflexota bacterium]
MLVKNKKQNNMVNPLGLIDMDYEENSSDIIEDKQDNYVHNALRNVAEIAKNNDDAILIREVQRANKAVQALDSDVITANQRAMFVEKQSEQLSKTVNSQQEELEAQIKETLFARAAVGTDTKELLSLQHHINRNSNLISHFTTQLIDAVKNHEPEKTILDLISKIDIKNNEIATFAQFVTKANFNTNTNKISQDLIAFVNEYIENVYKNYSHHKMNGRHLVIEIENIPKETFIKSFRPIEVIILMDNFISNAERANATKLIFRWHDINDEMLKLHIIDNGDGIDDAIIDKIFDFRFTTTSGAGLGLYHCFDVIKKLNGEIQVNNKVSKGVEFTLTFNR